MTTINPNDGGNTVSITVSGSGSIQGHINDATGAHAATAISYAGAANLSATTVEAALDELDTEKAALASPALTGNPTAPTPAAGDNDTSIATTAYVVSANAKLAPVPGAGLLVITMDDAYSEMLTVANALSARAMRGTFCITTDLLNGAGKLTNADVLTIYGMGHEIAAHSKSHADMASLTAAQRVTEWDTPKSVLEGIIGSGKVTTWSYPYGTQGSARTATADQECYTRYDRMLDTGAQSINVVYPRTQPTPPLIVRNSWNDTNQEMCLEMVRTLSRTAAIGSLYFHRLDQSVNPTTAQLTELLDLAQSLGVRCVTAAEAFGTYAMLGNPSFESSTTSIAPWYPFTAGAGTVTVADGITPDTGISGSRALRLSCGPSPAFAYVRQIVPVIPGRTYTLSYRAKVISGTVAQANDAYGRITGLDYAQTSLNDAVLTGAPTAGTWAKKSVDYTAPATACYVRVELVTTDIAVSTVIDFDHVWFGPKEYSDLG